MDLRLFGWFCKYQLLSLTQLRAEYPRGVNVTKLRGQRNKLGGHRNKTPVQGEVASDEDLRTPFTANHTRRDSITLIQIKHKQMGNS